MVTPRASAMRVNRDTEVSTSPRSISEIVVGSHPTNDASFTCVKPRAARAARTLTPTDAPFMANYPRESCQQVKDFVGELPRKVIQGNEALDEDSPRRIVKGMRSDEIGERIRELRTKRGLTQLTLAAAARVDNSMLSKVERGSTVPSVDWLEKIAPALGAVLVLELVEAAPKVKSEPDSVWAQHVDTYLRSARGRDTPGWAAAQLMAARHSHLEAEADVLALVHKTRRELERAATAPDETQNHPRIDVPPRKRR